MSNFFKDLTVVELSSVLAGPAVGMFFAELGAQVIKVENETTGGDVTRKWKLPSENEATNVSAYFSSVNYKKQYLFYDFSNPMHKARLQQLIAKADVVLVNFKKGDGEKFGLTYNDAKQLNEAVIYAHLTGYGEHNPKTAFDVVLQAETGFMSMNGTTQSGPVKMPVALIDILAAHQLKEAILLALLKRNKTGLGSNIHVSLYESAVASLANQASNYLMEGHIAQPMGTLHPNIAPYGEVLTTKDNEQLVLAVGSNAQFKNLCAVLNVNDLVENVRFSQNKQRVINRQALHNLLNQASRLLMANELEHAFIKYNVPHGFIHPINKVFENPLANKMVRIEDINGVQTKRVSTIAFDPTFLND